MCAEKQHNYTVVLTRRDGVYRPVISHIEAYNQELAEVKATIKGYVVVAIFHGHLEAL